ncbi:MAG: class II aldolase [Leptospiraceae bacterium]|nr:class II aldolase [Leptospiraceae bacterium]
MNELENFILMSKYAGERFDIVQAGGGNSSVKLEDGSMLIKASGFSLSEITNEKGYVKLDNKKVNEVLSNSELLEITDKRKREKASSDLIGNCILDSTGKPSIETFLHSLLGKYTLHTHPIAVNAITVQKDWKEILTGIFPNAVFVDYKTPGIELALELQKELNIFQKDNGNIPQILFLQNHGLIVSSSSYEVVIELNESVLEKLENYLGLDFTANKNVTKISKLYNSIYRNQSITYLIRSQFLNSVLKDKRELFFLDSFCPDGQVFCGRKALNLESLDDADAFFVFEKEFYHPARIILYKDNLYAIAPNVKKAKEMEDVLEFQISSLFYSKENRNFLEKEEVIYLENWDAEKYRQKL